MFTGIIEETGLIKRVTADTIEVGCKTALEGTKIGDSIAINGCCQTVTALRAGGFSARVSPETFHVTNFGSLKAGSRVNLERALTLSTRMGGHIVTGHVDCCGRMIDKRSAGEFFELSFEIPQEFVKYIVYKGSVALNGVSLTVAAVSGNIFKTAVIPHTWENTVLEGIVNIETDVVGKYIEKFVCSRDNKITADFLEEHGFI